MSQVQVLMLKWNDEDPDLQRTEGSFAAQTVLSKSFISTMYILTPTPN